MLPLSCFVGRPALLGSFRNTKYDEPDPLVDPLVKRDEDRWDVVLSTTVPLSRQFALNAAVNYTDNSATLPNFEFDNLGGSLGIAWTF